MQQPLSISSIKCAYLLAQVLFFFSSTFSSFGQPIARLDGSKIEAKQLEQKIAQMMSEANVSGVGVSIFNQNESVFKNFLLPKSVNG